MGEDMFTEEELKELKLCVNEMISSRIQYSHLETNDSRLVQNKKYLDLDYELLEKIINGIN